MPDLNALNTDGDIFVDTVHLRVRGVREHHEATRRLDPDTVNKAQIKELISVLASEERVVIVGDFNCHRFEDFDIFKDAGYTLGNDGSFATFPTGKNNRALDNIIVKGLKVSDVCVHPTSLSDHNALSADVSLL